MSDDKACGHDELETLRQVIAGEAARTAAAVAAKAEEVRQACWDVVSDNHDEPYSKTLRALASMPLTATPLADRVAELERSEALFAATAKACEKAEAERDERVVKERDALRAQVAEAAERLDEFGSQPTLADGIQAMRLRLVELRAQVEAVRAACARFVDAAIMESKWAGGCRDAATEVLAAMDGAKPSTR